MKIMILWAAIIIFSIWSLNDKTAPLHAFIAHNGPVELVTATVLGLALFCTGARGERRRIRRRQQ